MYYRSDCFITYPGLPSLKQSTIDRDLECNIEMVSPRPESEGLSLTPDADPETIERSDNELVRAVLKVLQVSTDLRESSAQKDI